LSHDEHSKARELRGTMAVFGGAFSRFKYIGEAASIMVLAGRLDISVALQYTVGK
jgi:hypothetical protein